MNKRELETYMKKNGDTQESLAQAMGISRISFNRKMNGHMTFTQYEILLIKKRYRLSGDEIVKIFFDEKAS